MTILDKFVKRRMAMAKLRRRLVVAQSEVGQPARVTTASAPVLFA